MSERRPSRKQLASWNELRRARERRSRGELLVEGARLVGELLDSEWPCLALLLDTDRANLPAVERALALAAPAVPRYALSARELERLGETVTPPPLMAIAGLPTRDPDAARRRALHGSPLLVLDGVGDPGNAGTLLRSALAFGFGGAVFVEGSVSPTNGKLLRAAMGAAFRLPWVELPAAQLEGALEGVARLAAVPRGGVSPSEARPAAGARWALLLGGEADGLRAPLADRLEVSLPMAEASESLNVAVAGSVLMYALTTRATE